MAAIKAVAEKSETVTSEAIGALTQNDAAIEEAADPVVQRRLVADNLLVFRNFVSAVIRGVTSYGSVALAKARAELGPVAKKRWEEIEDRLPKSVGETAAMVPKLALVGLAVWLIHAVAGIAAIAPLKPMAKNPQGFSRSEKSAEAKRSTQSGNIGDLKAIQHDGPRRQHGGGKGDRRDGHPSFSSVLSRLHRRHLALRCVGAPP